jgi:hypothetical protein
MTMLRWSMVVCAGVIGLGSAGGGFGQEKTEPAPPFGMTGSAQTMVRERELSGFCDAAVQWLPHGNAVCYAITKSPKEKERYLYLLVIKTGLTKPGGTLGLRGEARSKGKQQDNRFEIKLLDEARRIPIAYRFQTDPKTKAVVSEESLTIGNLKPKPNDRRVILIDLTGKEPSYQAVEVAFPATVPPLADAEGKAPSAEERARILSQAIGELEEKSPTVKTFLARKPKEPKK